MQKIKYFSLSIVNQYIVCFTGLCKQQISSKSAQKNGLDYRMSAANLQLYFHKSNAPPDAVRRRVAFSSGRAGHVFPGMVPVFRLAMVWKMSFISSSPKKSIIS